MKKFLFRLSDAQARKNVVDVIRKHGLEDYTSRELRYFGLDLASASPERIRRAAVVAIFDRHRGESVDFIRACGKKDDEIIAELARAIGVIPITERHHYIRYSIPYKKAYHCTGGEQ